MIDLGFFLALGLSKKALTLIDQGHNLQRQAIKKSRENEQRSLQNKPIFERHDSSSEGAQGAVIVTKRLKRCSD